MDNNLNNFEQPSDNNQQENTSDLNNIPNSSNDTPNTYSPNSDSTDNISSDNSTINFSNNPTVNSSDNQTGYNDYVDISSNQNIENNQEQIQYYPRPEEYKWNYQQHNSHYDQYNQHNNSQYGQYNQNHNSQYGYNDNNQHNQNMPGYQYSPPQYNNYYNMRDIEQKEKERPRQGMAIASMILGICGIILSFCCCCIPIYGSFVAIAVSGIGLVLSILALSAGNRSGFAVSGIITSLIGVLISAALLIILYTGIMGLNEFQSMVNGGYNPFM